MKKIIIIIVLMIIMVISWNQGIFAQESSPTSQPSPTPTPQYQLPYPGLLPDNPLYFAKVLRDRIIGFLIADPLKKAEFDLLQADKRLNTAVALAKKGKYELAQSTVSKGENYFEQALLQLEQAQKQGMDTKSLTEKMLRAVKKHEEVIKSLGYEDTLKRVMGFEKSLSSLTSK